MWIQLEEQAPFRVVEMGAGSGQLSNDVQRCVRHNELGIAPSVWRRWAASFEYLIMERSGFQKMGLMGSTVGDEYEIHMGFFGK